MVQHAHHFGVMGHLRSQFCAIHVDLDGERKKNNDNAYAAFGESGEFTPEYNQGFQKAVDEDTSNRSSSGSAISNSESCVQFCGTNGSDLTDPSKKRTSAGCL